MRPLESAYWAFAIHYHLVVHNIADIFKMSSSISLLLYASQKNSIQLLS
jgi:hypothetical protein